MIRYKRNCTVCQMCRDNPKLRARIYKTFYQEEKDTSLKELSLELGKSVKVMWNHCEKHLSVNPARGPGLIKAGVERIKATVAKETELSFDHSTVVPKQDYEQVIDTVLAEGLKQLVHKGKSISVSQLLAAAKIKADYTGKRRGQDTELIKTMYRMVSNGGKNIPEGGEDQSPDGITGETGAVVERRTVRPRVIYQSSTRYAAAQRSGEVSEGDTEAEDPDKHPDLRQPLGEEFASGVSPPVVSLL